MISRKFALIGGMIIMAIGLFSLIPTLSVYSQSLPELNIEASYGYFLGIFPMNILNKSALILMGLAGMICSNLLRENATAKSSSPIAGAHDPAIIWSRVLLYVTGSLAVLGMFEQTNTLGGYWPLFGAEVWLHTILALLGGFFGYIAHEVPTQSSRKLHKV